MLVGQALLRNFSDQEAPGFGWPHIFAVDKNSFGVEVSWHGKLV
jgi:hypothetical protein